MFGNRAQYTWGTDGPVLWLEDHGINCRSLTNDIENCLVEIQAQLGANNLLTNYFIIYRDSEMEWDALEITEFGDWELDHQWLESSKKTGRPYWSHGIKINFKYLESTTFELAKAEIQEMANYSHPCLKLSKVEVEEGEADRVPI